MYLQSLREPDFESLILAFSLALIPSGNNEPSSSSKPTNTVLTVRLPSLQAYESKVLKP